LIKLRASTRQMSGQAYKKIRVLQDFGTSKTDQFDINIKSLSLKKQTISSN